ncbi:FecCD family ABC transporter permease [Halovivax limisalsi]|uniref:FecCD family ABC transporter permease n=1 Tax=Halovivax limisalsi TaxID=1453760 RepID=UPI001FFDE9CD|nr:iron ABC transporter permease [Halovivax limisalsi]
MHNETAAGGTTQPGTRDTRRFAWLLDPKLLTTVLVSSVVVALAGLVQVSFGAYSMTMGQAWGAVVDPTVLFDQQAWSAFLLGGEVPEMDPGTLIVWNIRLPRVFVAVIVGMNLAVSGAIFQAITRNELASPFILGVSSGAGLMILLALVAIPSFVLAVPFVAATGAQENPLGWAAFGAWILGLAVAWRYGLGRRRMLAAGLLGLVGLAVAFVAVPGVSPPVGIESLSVTVSSLLPILAALGGAVAFLVVYAIAWKNGTSPVRLVLAGVIVGTFFGSLQTALFYFADDIGVVQSAIAWTTGSLTGTDWEQVRLALPWSIVAMVLALAGARQCNVLLLGERTARSLGMSIEKVRFALSGVAVLAAAASIAVAGIVGFVGLIVPHMVRNLVGSDYKKVIVGCLFVGPALLVSADVGARLGLSVLMDTDRQVPVGIVTGLVGGPYFLYLMRKQEHMGQI